MTHPQLRALGGGLGQQGQFGIGLNQQVMGLQQQLNAQMQAIMQAQFKPTPAQQRQLAQGMLNAAGLDPSRYMEDPDYRAAKDLINETISHYNQEDEDADKLD